MTILSSVRRRVAVVALMVTALSGFVAVRPLGIPFLNLVGNRCQTATPITLTLSGPVDLTAGSTFSGTYTVPRFKNCGLTTPILNLIVPGGGNTFTATARPPAA
jgi:hypothetical protein